MRLRIVGGSALALALAGLYMSVFAWARMPEVAAKAEIPGVMDAAIPMLAVSTLFCLLLGWAGVLVLRGRIEGGYWLAWIAALEVCYSLGVAILWRVDAPWNPALVAASGAANVGMVPQWMVLFPVWGPIVAIREHRRMRLEGRGLR